MNDTLIIGAGAAGLMTAITAKRAGVSSVLLLDSKEKIGAKILMSGGTRCNLTNQTVTPSDFVTEEKNILNSVLKFFPSDKAVAFFNSLGVEVILEDEGKYFPSTHSGATVLEALLKEIDRLGIVIEAGRKVTNLTHDGKEFIVTAGDSSYRAKTVAITTGGLSFPTSGSDGSGYELAKSFGHSLIPTSPSLTPLVCEDEEFRKLSGLTLPVKLSLWKENKKQIEHEGSFLFTHMGFSGPVVLDISRHWIRNQKNGVQLKADFLPQITEEKFSYRVMDQINIRPNRQVITFMTEFLPARFVEVLFRKIGMAADTTFNSFRKEHRQTLINLLFRYPLEISGDLGYKKAEVTAGGVDLSQVERKTLQSKLQPGLFFAGEILDVDGRIGGFNFQWAWSSGTVAGLGIAEALKTHS